MGFRCSGSVRKSPEAETRHGRKEMEFSPADARCLQLSYHDAWPSMHGLDF